MSVLLALGAYGYHVLGGRIKTFSAGGLQGNPKAAASSMGAENILLIGSDARGGQNSKLGGAGGVVGRSDTTALVHVYPGHTSAVAVSIPRDTLVTIPACRLPDGSWTRSRSSAMFNSAFSTGSTARGNPACTVNTVEQMTGLTVDHTVVANFAGFAAMSQAVGGVPVCLPHPVYQGDLDPNLGRQGRLLFHAGRQLVSGAKALQYVRVRHGLGDGSDIGRIKRQQAFLGSLVTTIRHEGLASSHLLALVDAATKNLTFDPSLASPARLLAFALSLRSLDPRHITFVTMPWRYDGPRVSVVQPDANQLSAALRDNRHIDGSSASQRSQAKKAQPPRGSGDLTVLNGTWTSGLAAHAAARLHSAGYSTTIGNAAVRSFTGSEIHYPPQQLARARLLQKHIRASLVPDAHVTHLTLILGVSAQRWLSSPAGGGTAAPSGLPKSVTSNLRKATSNPCSNLTYG